MCLSGRESVPAKYSDELRREAVSRVLGLQKGSSELTIGRACEQVGKELGVAPTTLGGWSAAAKRAVGRVQVLRERDPKLTLARACEQVGRERGLDSELLRAWCKAKRLPPAKARPAQRVETTPSGRPTRALDGAGLDHTIVHVETSPSERPTRALAPSPERAGYEEKVGYVLGVLLVVLGVIWSAGITAGWKSDDDAHFFERALWPLRIFDEAEPTTDYYIAPQCNPNYTGCVPNSMSDINCSQVAGPVYVVGFDVYRLDGNRDGIGCE